MGLRTSTSTNTTGIAGTSTSTSTTGIAGANADADTAMSTGANLRNPRQSGAFGAPSLLVVASLICAITGEELLGYQVIVWRGIAVSSYVVLLLSQMVFAGGLLAFGPRWRSLIARPLALAASAAASLIGAVLAVAGTIEPYGILLDIGFLLLSLGSLSLKIINLELLAQTPPRTVATLIFTAAIFQSLCAPLFTLSGTLTWMLAGIIAAAGFACAAAAQPAMRRSSAAGSAKPAFQRRFSPTPSVLIGVGILCAGILYLNPLSFYPSFGLEDFMALTFLSHFFAAGLFGLVVFLGRDSSYATPFKCIDTLVLGGFLLMALVGAGSLAPRAVCTTTFSLFEFVTLLAIVDLASYSRTNRLRLFGGYYLLMRSCSLAGIALNADDVIFAASEFSFSLLGTALALACIVAAIWLLTEPHLNRFFWGNPVAEIERASRANAKTHGAVGLASGGNNLASGSDAPPASNQFATASTPGETATASTSDEFTATQASDLEALIERSVQQLAERHSLTPREREVLGLMAQGRSSTFIGEKLFVSSNTVRKHIAHVYEKLGVHSKQELLTLVQQESSTL